MATELRKLVRAAGSYLHFEQLCRRTELFEEAYLSVPIGHFLMSRYGQLVRAEYPHQILVDSMEGPGRRPSVDYVVLDDAKKKPRLAIEAKWANSGTDFLALVVRDLVRLELLQNEYGCASYFLLAGTRRRIESLFARTVFQPAVGQPSSLSLLPTGLGERRAVRLEHPSRFRKRLVEIALEPFDTHSIAPSVPVVSAGRFPEEARKDQVCVYGWRLEPSKGIRFQHTLP